MNKQPYWFPAKRHGWGWGLPQAWQGWVVFVVWLALLFGGVAVIAPRHRPRELVLFVVAVVLSLVLVCLWKGEPPRWRWGGRER